MKDQPLYSQNAHWRTLFYDETIPGVLDKVIQERWIPSGSDFIHLDVYQAGLNAPTVIYCHGLSSTGRMMAHLVLPLYQMGYNVICPDLAGFGMSTRRPGSGTIPDFVQNLKDTAAYARQHFKGRVFLAGISMGGGLSYYAAADEAGVDAIGCFCLMDFSHPDTLKVSKKASLVKLIRPILGMSVKFIPDLYLPLQHFLDVNNLADEPYVVNLFKTHPLINRQYTYLAAYSLLTSKPKIPFEKFDRIPTLVMHADQDRLIPEWLSRKNYEKLACKKHYVSLESCGHVPVTKADVAAHAKALDEWFGRVG